MSEDGSEQDSPTEPHKDGPPAMSEDGSEQDSPTEPHEVKTGRSKGRRWSLETITPLFHPWKRSVSTVKEGSESVTVPPRLAQTTPGDSKGSGFHFPWRRVRRSSDFSAYSLGLKNPVGEHYKKKENHVGEHYKKKENHVGEHYNENHVGEHYKKKENHVGEHYKKKDEHSVLGSPFPGRRMRMRSPSPGRRTILGSPFPGRRGRRSSEMDAHSLGLSSHNGDSSRSKDDGQRSKDDSHGSGFVWPWKRTGRRSSEMDVYTALNHMRNPPGEVWRSPDADVCQEDGGHKSKDEVHGTGFTLPWGRARRTSIKEVYAVIDEFDGEPFVVTGENEADLKSLVGAAMMEDRVSSYRVIVASTKQFLRMDSGPSRTRSYENLLQHLQAVAEHSAQIDDRLKIVTEMFESEQTYLESLQVLFDSYAEPLRKFSSLSKDDHIALFKGVEPIFSLSGSLVKKLEAAVDSWDPGNTKIGNLFSNTFWNRYSDYYETFLTAKKFLEDKLSNDKAFEDFCHLIQQQGVPPPQALLFLPIKRITEYDKYLNDLLDETDTSHPDFEDLNKAATRVKNMVKDREEEVREAENDQTMETIQDRFPYDDLQLKADREKSQKFRGISVRRRSAPSAVVFKTLSGNRSRSSSSIWSQGNMGRKDADTLQAIKNAADPSRLYIMEGPVQFAMGMQTQERYLFLFSDLLLVAKQKSSTTFKLKHRIPLCDIWLATCVDEVSETTRPLDKSFVIGWPTYNVVATFRDAETKEKWMVKLTEHVNEEKMRLELKEIPLKVVVRDMDKPATCPLTVTNSMQARDVLRLCLQQLDIPDSEAKENYKLWVWSGKENSAYPLIGHETPFSIRVSQLRELARARGDENMTLSELSVLGDEPPNLKLEFILKQKKTPKKHSLEDSHKAIKKAKRSPLLNIFKKGREDKANNNTSLPQGELFGHPLASVSDSDNTPPKTIVELLTVLFRYGPETHGIFRRSANVRHCRELKERLDKGKPPDLDDSQAQALVVGAVLKEYLRTLPDPLLCERLFDEWVRLSRLENGQDKLQQFKDVLSQLPTVNLQLLKRIVCVLHHIQGRSDDNKMNSYNLSLCITPSLIWHKDTATDLSAPAPAVQYMVDHCTELFGEDVLMILGEPLEYKSRQDSGTDSDSMHSVLSMQDTGNGLRRDDSSIDSLVERELYTGEGGESSPKLGKSHLSPSNLSRDSGLTLSDTQLYDDDSTDHHSDHHHHHHHRPKPYHRTVSHYADDYELERYSLDAQPQPVAPPRKRGKRPGSGGADDGHELRLDSGGGGGMMAGIRGRDKRHTLHSSASSSVLLDTGRGDIESQRMLAYSVNSESFRPVLSHPSFSKQVSSESLGREGVEQNMDREEFQEYAARNKSMDIGLLRKSASGAHLFLDDEQLPRKFSESSGVPRQQSGGVDSTPPLSPQSKYSYSSRDSVISDSSYGAGSRENSVNSAPQTPDDDHADRMPPWLPVVEPEEPSVGAVGSARSQRFAMSLNIPPHQSLMMSQPGQSFSSSYSGSQLRSVQNVRYLVSPPASPVKELESQGFQQYHSRQDHAFQAPPPSPWPGKSHEAEDVSMKCSPQIHITGCSSSSDEKLDESGPGEEEEEEVVEKNYPASMARSIITTSSGRTMPLEIPQPHPSLPVKQISKYSQSNISKGSPPPRVLLQSLRSPRSGRDPAPVRASHDSDILAQIQRGGLSSSAQDVQRAGLNSSSLEPKSSDHHSGSSAQEASTEFAVRSMEAINTDEYIHVKPRLTVIKREESIHSNTSTLSSVSTGSGSSLGNQSISTLSTSPSSGSGSSSGSSTISGHSRPSKPPSYQEALQRSFMIQHDVPVDVTESQRQASERAKALYEESLQKYLQERYEQKHKGSVSPRVTRKISDPGSPNLPVTRTSRSKTISHVKLSELRYDPDTSMVVASPKTSGPKPSASDDDVYVTLSRDRDQRDRDQKPAGKTPREIYLESLQRYEEQVSSSGTKVSVRSSLDSCVQQRTEVTVQARAHGQQSSPRPKSLLEIPVSSLHRSHSDSAEHINKIGQYRSRSTEVLERDSHSRNASPARQRDTSPGVVGLERKSSDITVYDRRDRSESSPARHHFKTTSCFYHPDDSPRGVQSETVSGTNTPVSRSPRAASPRLDTTDSVKSQRVESHTDYVKSPRDSRIDAAKSRRVDSRIDSVKSPRGDSRTDYVKSSKDSLTDFVKPPRGDSNTSTSQASKVDPTDLRSPRTAVSAGGSSGVNRSVDAPVNSKVNSTGGSGVHATVTSSVHFSPGVQKTVQGRQSSSVSVNINVGGRNAGTSGTVGGQSRAETVTNTRSNVITPTPPASVPKQASSAKQDSSATTSASAPSSAKTTTRDLPWSVKNLKKIYDPENQPGEARAQSGTSTDHHLTQHTLSPRGTSSTAASGRPGPPPYQDPPPFKRLQDVSRMSTSSNSSNGSNNSTGRSTPPSKQSSKRLGPQSASLDYSSSEDMYYSSSRWSARGRSESGSGSGLSDQELTNPYTDISYV